jgi:hypothetical protein
MENSDIITTIINNVIPTGDRYKIKYLCAKGTPLKSPVDGYMSTVNDNEVIITPTSGVGTLTIKDIEWVTSPKPSAGPATTVVGGSDLGAKTNEGKVYLTSNKQDLSHLLKKPEKEETSKKLSTGLGLSKEDAKRIATDAVSGTIGISNAPYQATLDQLKKIEALKIESNEIKDNVLSEELKRIKSLF